MMKPDLKMMEQTRALFLLLLYVTHYWPPCKETVATRIYHGQTSQQSQTI